MQSLFLILSVAAGAMVAWGLREKRRGRPADAKIVIAAVIAIVFVAAYAFTGGPATPVTVQASPAVAAEKAGAAIAEAKADARVLVVAFPPAPGTGAEGDPAYAALKKGLGGRASIVGTVAPELPGAGKNPSADQMLAARMMAAQFFTAAALDRMVEPYMEKTDVVVLLVPPPGNLGQSTLAGRGNGPRLAVATPADILPPLELFQNGTIAAAVLSRPGKKDGDSILIVTPGNAAAVAAETPEVFLRP